MARFWKEPYSRNRAEEIGIHDFEGTPVVGSSESQWIYYVEVCRFAFAFFSLAMMRQYLDFFSRKILPSSRFYRASPFSSGAGAGVGDGQSMFERLPLRLRKEPRRLRIVKAFERALKEFRSVE